MASPGVTAPVHVHQWVETETGCEDCGTHPAVRCDAEGDCPLGTNPIDLIWDEDPRDGRPL